MNKRKAKETEQTLSEGEWAVMKVVWEHEACAAGTVKDALQASHGWAYSTVKTMMDRMVKKGLLTTQSVRNLSLFSSCISQEEAQRGELKKCLQRAFGGNLTPMLQFLVEEDELTDDEIRQLRRMIAKTSGSGSHHDD